MNPNLELLRAMAVALGPLRERLVFVGGCATGLLITNPAAADVRPTEDVVITVIDGRAELADELARAEAAVRRHVVDQTNALLAHPEMANALPGIVAQPIRAGIVLQRIQDIASLNSP
ncbi:hypothetical protein ACVNIS_06705 [Sphaerotilaceae bacterium SBD11-9]